VLKAKFGRSGKTGRFGFLFWNIRFSHVHRRIKDKSQTRRFKNSRHFEAWKMTKKHQGTKIEENQSKSQGHKNRTIQFGIPKYLVFSKERVQLRFEV
jgi:hypothetical protein